MFILRTSCSFQKVVLFAVLVGTGLGAITSVASDNSPCPNSTVEDAWGADVSLRAQHFLEKLQFAVRHKDKVKVSKLIHYPVRINEQTRTKRISTPAVLLREYSSIFNADLEKAILTQSARCLFANGQGIMIGSGEIWFNQEPGGQMKIVTINIDSNRN